MAANKELANHLQATKIELENFVLRLDKFLAQNIKPIIKKLQAKDATGYDAAQVLGSLRETLINAGLENEIARLESPYARQLNFIRSQFSAAGVKDVYADVDLNVVQKLIDFDLDKVAANIDQFIGDARSTLMTTVLGGNTDELENIFTEIADRYGTNLQNELVTMTQGFSRAVTADVGKSLGFTLWEYIGPEDSITRPFCDKLLQKNPPIYSEDEIARMDNGQGLDVMTYGGGWNCRHQWRPVSQEKAEDEGYDS